MLEINTKAPDFTLPDKDGNPRQPVGFSRQESRSLFLSQGQHSGLYQTGMRLCGGL